MIEIENCRLCGLECKSKTGVGIHLRFKHKDISYSEYQEVFFPRFCLRCGWPISYEDPNYHNKTFCSKKCLKLYFSGRDVLNEGKRKYEKEFLLDYLRDLHKKYKGYVTQKLVNESGDLNHVIYHTYFGGLTNACKLAGVPCLGKYHMRKYYKKDVVRKIQEVYKKTNLKMSYELLYLNSDLTMYAITKFFSGIGEACEYAEVPHNLEDKKIGKEMVNKPRLIIDTNEKKPYKFKNAIFKKMNVGDYMSADNFNGIVFERKSIKDLKSTMSGGKMTKRFEREMERARKNNWYVLIIIDGSRESFFKSKYYGWATNKGLYHNIKEFGSKYADVCQFVFTESRYNSMKIVLELQDKFPNELINIDYQAVINLRGKEKKRKEMYKLLKQIAKLEKKEEKELLTTEEYLALRRLKDLVMKYEIDENKVSTE